MEDKKVKAGSVAVGICLFVIAILLVLMVIVFYNSTIEKNNLQAKINELETTIKEKDNKVNELENKISKVSDVVNDEEKDVNDNIYGYLSLYKEDKNISEIYELHSNSNNKKIAEVTDRIYSFTLKHNSLYFYTQQIKTPYNEKTFYIDLSNEKYNLVELTNGIDIEYYFDNTEKYLFSAFQHRGIKKIDISNNSEEMLMENIGAFELYIKDSLIYVQTESQNEGIYYYTIDFEGKNYKKITKDEYENNSNLIQYIEPIKQYENEYYIYKDKKISLAKDCTEILFDNNTIYTTNNNKKIELLYTDLYGKIAFKEYKSESYQILDEKYYLYDIETRQIKEIKENEAFEKNIIIK